MRTDVGTVVQARRRERRDDALRVVRCVVFVWLVIVGAALAEWREVRGNAAAARRAWPLSPLESSAERDVPGMRCA